MQTTFRSGGITLTGHLARPEVYDDGPLRGLVLCHDFPSGGGAPTTDQTYQELADRIADDAGWAVLTFSFRGVGASEGDFSLGGWVDDVRAAIDHLSLLDEVEGVWLCGLGTGGAIAICAAGEDDRVRGVASMAAQCDFAGWASDPAGFLEHCREIGVIRDPDQPADVGRWQRELRETSPLALISKVAPRPVLVVHGSDDEAVPPSDARALVAATDGEAELRIVSGAGHRLRHDPRAIAVLLGWLERQQTPT